MREQLRTALQQNAAVVQGAGCLLLAVDVEQRITFMEGATKDQMLRNNNIVGPIEGQDLLALSPDRDFHEAYKAVVAGDIVRVVSFPCSFLSRCHPLNAHAILTCLIAHCRSRTARPSGRRRKVARSAAFSRP